MMLLKNPISKPIQKNNTICKSERKKKIYEKTIARRHHLNPIQPPNCIPIMKHSQQRKQGYTKLIRKGGKSKHLQSKTSVADMKSQKKRKKDETRNNKVMKTVTAGGIG